MKRILAAIAGRVPAPDCCPHPDPEAAAYTVHGEITAAVEEIDAGDVSTARQILVTLLAALDKEAS